MPVTFEVDVLAPTINPGLAFAMLADLIRVSREWATDVRNEARRYPLPRAGSRYVRTNRLRNGWAINGPSLNGSYLETTVTNPVAYSRYVHGNNTGQQQSWFHQGRWNTVQGLGSSVTPLAVRAQAALALRMQSALVTQTIRATP